MASTEFEARRVATSDELAALQHLAERIFPAQDRATGWWARKLHRECIEAPRSFVLRRRSDGAAVGYALAGNVPSLGAHRAASLGVRPDVRTRGGGRLLVNALLEDADACGRPLQLRAGPATAGFFRRVLGSRAASQPAAAHWIHRRRPGPGEGAPRKSTDDPPPRLPWPEHPRWSEWLAEAWERDPGQTWHYGDADCGVLCSRESGGTLTHCVHGADLDRAIECLREAKSREPCLIVAEVTTSGALAKRLPALGFSVAQPFCLWQSVPRAL